jgi:hypothetical protein
MSGPKQWVGIAGGVFVGLAIGAAVETRAAPKRDAVPDVMRARQFQVVDGEGAVRMQLGVETDGVSRLTLFGPNNKKSLVAQVDARGETSLSLRDTSEQERASLSFSEEKGTVIALTSPETSAGQPIAALAVLPDNSEALSLVHISPGEDGKPVRTGSAIVTTAAGKTELRYYGKNGKERTVSP